jgi:hypothetical protein
MSLRTLVTDQFENDPEAVLYWLYGADAAYRFLNHRADGQRSGQAFMNVLRAWDPDSYARLTGSDVDPFYLDEKITVALDRLTSK